MSAPAASWYTRGESALVIRVHAQPGARSTAVAGIHGAALKIRLQAPALEDRANDALLDFVARRLGISRREVILAAGARSREKTLKVPAACNPRRLLDEA